MSYDGLFAGVIARQLNRELIGAKIEKIHQPEPDEIVMQLHCNGRRKKLLISVASTSASVYFTEQNIENPPTAPAFCMLLRKHIQGGRIVSVSQIQTERIIEFYVETVNEMGFSVNKKLIAETMGKHSNLILVDISTEKIIDSIKRISIDINRYRQILPGLSYVMPPSQNKLDFWTSEKAEIYERIQQSKEEGSKALLSSVQGIGPIAAEELWTAGPREKLADRIIDLRVKLLSPEGIVPTVYSDECGIPKDVHVFPLSHVLGNYKTDIFQDPGTALDFYFSNRRQSNRVSQKGTNLERTVGALLDKLLLKKQRLLEDIKQAEEADILRLKGELLNANLYQVAPGARSVTVKSYYDQSDVTIELDTRFSASKNAQNYYKKYAKAKTAKKEKLLQLLDTEKDIAYIESVFALISLSETYEELNLLRQELAQLGYIRTRKTKDKPVKSKPTPRKYTSLGGLKIMVGRNNTENDYLTFSLAGKTDLWFHAKGMPGSHVVLFLKEKEPENEDLLQAAALAAYYSKGKDSENVPVDYTYVKHVKKPSGSKPGMVIFTHQKTVYVNPEKYDSE